jgi:uncharacterized membrane protein YfcA
LTIVVYAIARIYTAPFLLISAGLCVPYLLGIWIGARSFHKVPGKLFFRLAIGLVLAAGLIALIK